MDGHQDVDPQLMMSPHRVASALLQCLRDAPARLRRPPGSGPADGLPGEVVADRGAPAAAPLTLQADPPQSWPDEALQGDLHTAVFRDQIELHYQPQLDMRTGLPVGAEALMRWHHPVRGWVPPSEFIPTAEASGLIVRLGWWALREACTQARWWPQDMRVAVNVSACQLEQPHLVRELKGLLASVALAPERLELEITESQRVADTACVRQTLRELRRLGVRISLDDFGTGQSSLDYLSRWPVDALKIDRSFVQRLDADSRARAVVHALVQVAQALGLRVTAEGIETQGQRRAMRALGCSDAQGFLFARALPPDHVAEFLRSGRAGRQ